jgi:single-strand DNA-binding protein
MIKLQVIGNLGKDCLTNQVNGKNVMNFNVAHTEKFKDRNNAVIDKTTWVECAYWSDKTGIAPYLKKGTQVYVEGQPEVRTYTKQDGSTGVSLALRVISVQLLGNKDGNTQRSQTSDVHENANAGSDISPEPVDDLPF